MFKTFAVGRLKIGPGCPVFIVAEAGVNHNGDIRLAKQLIDAAKKAGADAVKFQSFKASKIVTVSAPKAKYQLRHTPRGQSQFEMLRKLELSVDDHIALVRYCKQKKIIFLSSPFDEESADLLDELGLPAFKIGSGEITNCYLLEHIAKKKKPIILSTGMSSLKDVSEAVKVILNAGCLNFSLLQCVSNYPADPKDVNLRAMETLRRKFQVPIGFSDHTPGIAVALAAVALGASVIEKHLTLNRRLAGPDHAASLEPKEFSELVNGVRCVEAAFGDGKKIPTKSEVPIAAMARRSLVAAGNIRKGQAMTRDLIEVKRPGTGLKPMMLNKILGKKAKRYIAVESLFTMDMFQ